MIQAVDIRSILQKNDALRTKEIEEAAKSLWKLLVSWIDDHDIPVPPTVADSVDRLEDALYTVHKDRVDIAITQEQAKHLLLDHMRTLSEENRRAGWYKDLEYVLWNAVTGQENLWSLPHDDCVVLRFLADRANGWWICEDGTGKNVFLPMSDWKSRVEV